MKGFLKVTLYFLFPLTFNLALVNFIFAEEKTEIEEVVISATKIEESVEDIPASITVITKKEIESSPGRNVTDVLREVVGLRINSYGTGGTLALPSIRGATAAQVLILLDGKRLNVPNSGQFDLNNLPVLLEDIERIEVLRGASSALYGGDALGGVINIITKKPKETYTTLNASYGSFDSQIYSFTTSGILKAVGYHLTALKEKSDGFRTNSNFDANTFNGSIGFDITPKSSLSLSLSYLDKDAGIPGSLSFPSPKARQNDKNSIIGLDYKGRYSDKLDLMARIYWNWYKLAFKDPDLLEDDSQKNTTAGGDIQVNYLYNTANLLTAGLEFFRETLNSTTTGIHDRTRSGVFLQDEIRPSDSLTIIPGLRFDSSYPGEEQLSPKISALYKLKASGFRASVGKGYRVPTFNDLYWPDRGFDKGNPDLKPERSIEYEIGWDQRFGEKIRTRTTAFRRDVRDLIIWMPDQSLIWSPSNIGEARILGLEFEGEIDINKFFSVGLNYTYLNPTDKNKGEKIPNQPRHQFNSLIRVNSSFGLRLSLDGRYVNNYVMPGNTSGYFVMDGKISQRVDFSSKLKGEAFLLVKNIFDREYQTVKDYPMPPREIYGGLSITF